MGLKGLSKEDILDKIRITAWPNADDAAQIIYDSAKDKGIVELKYSPIIYSLSRRALTFGIIAGLAVGGYYLSKKDYSLPQNKVVKTYQLNESRPFE